MKALFFVAAAVAVALFAYAHNKPHGCEKMAGAFVIAGDCR